MENCPEVPVSLISCFGSPELKAMATSRGAADYLEKPFSVEDLGAGVLAVLGRESEGGTLRRMSTGTFLQRLKIEGRTCTVRILEETSRRRGVLFFRDGKLVDARNGGLRGEAPAPLVLSWDGVALSVQNGCNSTPRTVQGDLQVILLEATRQRDEAAPGEGPDFSPAGRPPPPASGPAWRR